MEKESQPTPRASRFVQASETKQIDLGNGDWVLIPKRFSYELAETFQDCVSEGKTKIAEFVSKAIVGWNLVEQDGVTIAPITVDTIKKLDVPDMMKIVTAINEGINIQTPPKAE